MGQPTSSSTRRTYLMAWAGRSPPAVAAFASRQMVDFLAVQHVAGADLDRVKTVENVELGQRQPGDATCPHRLPHQHGVEPAAAPLAAGVDAEFLAAAADLLADLVVEFGRERALADP